MTPRQLKDAMLQAADLGDGAMALKLVKEFAAKGYWVWEGKAGTLTGKEMKRLAKYDGHCQICDDRITAGSPIMGSAGSCAHVTCWQQRYGNQE